MSAIGEALETALRRVSEEVHEQARQGLGREVVGAVPGRPESEDVEIGIDSRCDEILIESLSDAGVTARVYSEHGVDLVGSGEPEYIVAVDPFDGSGLYRRGIPAEWWSVASYFDAAGTPLGASALDILRGELYTAGAEGVSVGPVNGDDRVAVTPSDRRSLDDSTTLAAYLMQPSYLNEWVTRMGTCWRVIRACEYGRTEARASTRGWLAGVWMRTSCSTSLALRWTQAWGLPRYPASSSSK